MTKAKLSYVYPEAPGHLIGRTLPELHHALACYERADEFDVINDHSGPPAAALGGAVATPVVHTRPRPARRGGRPVYEQVARASPQVGFISISLTSASRGPTCPGSRTPERARALALSLQAAPRRLPAVPGADEPRQGRHRAIAVAMETGLPLKIAGKQREPAEQRVLRAVRRSRTSATGSSTSAR